MRRGDKKRVGHGRGAAHGSVASFLEQGFELARRNPVPVVLLAAGAGWLLHALSRRGTEASVDDIPVLNTGQARVYDPDQSPRHPTHDTLESRREMSARM